MSRSYGVIHVAYWTNPEIKNLQDAPKLLGAYLLTSPHSNPLGAYRSTLAYISDDLSWSSQTTNSAIDKLKKIEFVEYDDREGWIYLPKYLRFNPPKNTNQGKNLFKLFNKVPASISFYARLAESTLDLGKFLPDDFLVLLAEIIANKGKSPDNGKKSNRFETVSKQFRKGFEEKDQDQDQDQDQDRGPGPGEKKRFRNRFETVTKKEIGLIVDLYHKILTDLPKVRETGQTIPKQIKARILENKARASLDYWESLFNIVKSSPFLMGRKKDWKASLTWITKPQNLEKIINGEYKSSSLIQEIGETAAHNLETARSWLQDIEKGELQQ